jgi:energy-converting hydrogenase Eha subunit G
MATSEQQHERGLDHRGERRLSGKESAVWYGVAAVSYIAIGTWQKVLLTWFIGPMWVVATLTLGPRLYDRLRERKSKTK